MFEWADLQEFLTFLDWVLCLPRNGEQVASLSYSLAKRQRRSGVSYTDVMVSPIHWKSFEGPLEEFIAAVASGLEEAERDGCPPVYLSISISRKHTRVEAHAVLDTMLAMGHPRVVALSIDGNEALAGTHRRSLRPRLQAGPGQRTRNTGPRRRVERPRGRVGRDRPPEDPAGRSRREIGGRPRTGRGARRARHLSQRLPVVQRAARSVSGPGVPSDPDPRRRRRTGHPQHRRVGLLPDQAGRRVRDGERGLRLVDRCPAPARPDVRRGKLLPRPASSRTALGHRCLRLPPADTVARGDTANEPERRRVL